MSRVLLTVSNEAYVPYVLRMLSSLNQFHPEQKVRVLAVNVTSESKQKVLKSHTNVVVIEENLKFNNDANEKGFLVCCRTWYIKSLMEELKSSVLYCDADVIFLDDISPFFKWLDGLDFAARVKAFKPRITVNAGILWCKYTADNLPRLDYWILRTKKRGIKWMSDQLAFNDMLNRYRGQIKFGNFPVEYNGLRRNRKSKIKHLKGSRKHKRRAG